MFQNSYQNGTYFDLFDPKSNQQKLKLLFKTVNVNGNNKVFDKDLKTYVFQFLTPNAKICLPRQEKKDLYLIQQYLMFQIYFFPGLSWNIQLTVSDLNKTKRRIILSPATTKMQIKPFFVKTPIKGFKEGVWNNFGIDLYSYMEAFKGQTYRSLDTISIMGHFKLRRIYSTTTQPIQIQGQNQSQQIKQINFLPKNFYFPTGVQYATKINRYDGDAYSLMTYEPTEPSTKNSSFLKSSKAKNNISVQSKSNNVKIQTSKTEKHIRQKQKQKVQVQTKKIKDFLSNTNGQLIARKNKLEEKSQSQSSQLIQPVSKTAKSTQKYSKKNLVKTQNMPPKSRSSLDKNFKNEKKTQEKSKAKAKLNPWRTNIKQAGNTDASQLQISKNQQQRSIDTPQTVSMFKNKNLTSKFSQTKNHKFEGKSDQYSDSQYVQLSQKFSTLTDGKFFKNQLLISNNHINQNKESLHYAKNEDEDEIQQNIEMQSNSMYSSSAHKKEEQYIKKQRDHEQIHESICDSLDRLGQHNEKMQKMQQLGRSSLYGFGQKLMRKFMGQIERPYSPPIGQREITQQQVSANHDEKQEVQLIYDPVLNCYYDHKTHTYYQLKN